MVGGRVFGGFRGHKIKDKSNKYKRDDDEDSQKAVLDLTPSHDNYVLAKDIAHCKEPRSSRSHHSSRTSSRQTSRDSRDDHSRADHCQASLADELNDDPSIIEEPDPPLYDVLEKNLVHTGVRDEEPKDLPLFGILSGNVGHRQGSNSGSLHDRVMATLRPVMSSLQQTGSKMQTTLEKYAQQESHTGTRRSDRTIATTRSTKSARSHNPFDDSSDEESNSANTGGRSSLRPVGVVQVAETLPHANRKSSHGHLNNQIENSFHHNRHNRYPNQNSTGYNGHLNNLGNNGFFNQNGNNNPGTVFQNLQNTTNAEEDEFNLPFFPSSQLLAPPVPPPPQTSGSMSIMPGNGESNAMDRSNIRGGVKSADDISTIKPKQEPPMISASPSGKLDVFQLRKMIAQSVEAESKEDMPGALFLIFIFLSGTIYGSMFLIAVVAFLFSFVYDTYHIYNFESEREKDFFQLACLGHAGFFGWVIISMWISYAEKHYGWALLASLPSWIMISLAVVVVTT